VCIACSNGFTLQNQQCNPTQAAIQILNC
jgi:hypothetical protein